MKLFRNLLDSVKPRFEKGGKLEKYLPAFDAIETFLFVPGHTAKVGSHVRDGIDLKRTMITVVLAMVPCLLFGMWNVGYQHFLALGVTSPELMDAFLFGAIEVLPMVIVAYAVGLGVEFAFAISRGHQVNEGYLVSGMLIPLIMPVGVPLWMVAVSVIFAVIIGKEVFGGTGMNILNPALTARVFLFFAYPTQMSGNKVWVNTVAGEGQTLVDGYSGATALGDLAATGVSNYSMAEMFIGTIPGSIGETSTLACLIGAAILLFTGVGSGRVIFSVFVGGAAMAAIFNAVAPHAISASQQAFMAVPVLEQLFLGGFMFGAIFMATDPVSAAQTNKGKYIYGFLIGFFAIMIRVFNPAYPEGMMLAILLMNVFAPLVDHYVVAGNIKRRLKRVKA
ncbi:MAG: Na+-transporting NADH:ubiquinone oxidoreductase subunit B [Candidatus Azotimanducaceae bacterium]|jgi:Na+-transporting NADH:ubiquinone oxidoreductase subunit B